jgi:protein translocase SEC61 complex gamma subunit
MLSLDLDAYRRVLHATKRPNVHEFKLIAKITSLGMAVIGLLGFVIATLFMYI